MDSVVSLTRTLEGQDHPMLTWYGSDGDRVDLAGKTLANWIIKATNLLTVELAAAPGTRVWLDLPTHWRTLVWGMATWCAGAEVVFTASSDAVVTAATRPEHNGLEVVVIALPALARRVDNLPPDAIDGAADLMSQADAFMFPPQSSAQAETGLGLTQSELLGSDVLVSAIPETSTAGHERVLIIGDDAQVLLRTAPALWAQGASVVLSHDPALAEHEGATHLLQL